MVPKVMIILGSASDLPVAQKAIDIFEELQIPYGLKVASAHRTHEKVEKLVIESTKNGVQVFIGIAGLAAHLSGSIASYTHRPVIGVPVEAKLGGLDALFATVQMPFPAPVATVGIDRGDNGAILAAEILGVGDEEIREKVAQLRKSYQIKVDESEKELLDSLNGKYLEKDFCNDLTSFNVENQLEDKEAILEGETPDVALVPGSYSDMTVAKKTAVMLDRMKITYDLNVISPIRYPEKFKAYLRKMKDVKVFIAVSGLSAHVTGTIVALTGKPVIGVPCNVEVKGLDALLSMTNMPPGVPVGTVGIENGRNGAILAGEIIGLFDSEIEENVIRVKDKTADL